MPNNFTWKEIKLDCWLVCYGNTALIATSSEVLQSAGRVGELYGHLHLVQRKVRSQNAAVY